MHGGDENAFAERGLDEVDALFDGPLGRVDLGFAFQNQVQAIARFPLLLWRRFENLNVDV
jgi:hypothetical protein